MLSLWRKGYYVKACPDKEAKKGQVHTGMVESDVEVEEGDSVGYIYHQNLPGLNWNTCLLIDSESSMDFFNNRKMLTNIQWVKKPLKLHCIAGYYMTKKG